MCFEVTATDDATGRSVDVTMTPPGGGTTQQSGVDPPMRRGGGGGPMEFTGHSGDFVYLSAQSNQGYGDVTCTITVNGTVLQTVTSSGA